MKPTINLWLVAALSLALFSACAKKQESPSATEANIVVVRMIFDSVVNAHNPAAVDKYFAANVVEHLSDMSKSYQGIKNMKARWTDLFAKIPDVHITVDEVFGSDNRLCVVSRMSGTLKGHSASNPGDDRKLTDIRVIDILRFKDGKCIDRWGISDQEATMTQLGYEVVPPSPSGFRK